MTPRDRLQRLLFEHRTAHDPASSEREILRMFEATTPAQTRLIDPKCWCEACDINLNGWRTRMSVCPECGDKRCARAERHDQACSTAHTKEQA